MELSMLLAIVAAAAIGAWAAALAVTVFVLAAEILEDLTVGRGTDALTDLMAFLPPYPTPTTDTGTRNLLDASGGIPSPAAPATATARSCYVAGLACLVGRRSSLRRSCALAATMTVDNDMRIAPIDMGNTNPMGARTPAASGTDARLYPAAHHRFCFILR